MTEPAESRQDRFIQAGPPPSWLLAGSDDPVPQPLIETAAFISDVSSAVPLPKPWLDTPWILDPVKVKALGYGGINRYWCHDYNVDPNGPLPQKRVGYAEVQAMIDAGVDFHWNGEDAAADFNKGYAFWLDTGRRMTDYADAVLKLPFGVGAFSSCDMDVGLQMTTVQLESQRGFRDGYQFGPAGIYGSSIAINDTMTAGTSVMGWLTIARYWSHGITPSLYHLDQNGSAFGGSADTNAVITTPFASLQQTIGGDMPTAQEIADAVWAKQLTPNGTATQFVIDTKNAATAAQNSSRGNGTKLDQLLLRPAPPSAAEIADAVIAAQGSAGAGGLTRQDLIDVINSTHLATQ